MHFKVALGLYQLGFETQERCENTAVQVLWVEDLLCSKSTFGGWLGASLASDGCFYLETGIIIQQRDMHGTAVGLVIYILMSRNLNTGNSIQSKLHMTVMTIPP